MATSRRLVILGIAIASCSWAGAVWGQSAPADDPVYQRYLKKFIPSTMPFDPLRKRTVLTAPASKKDVEDGKAVFTLEGLGEARVWNMPACPIEAEWVTLKQFPMEMNTGKTVYQTWCHVIQAEELNVNGKWQRYFGLVGKNGVAVAPAEEVDLISLISPAAPRVSWQVLPGGLGWGRRGPTYVEPNSPTHKLKKLDVGDPLPVEIYVRNCRGVARQQPTDFYRGPDQGGPAWRKGVRLIIERAPFDARRPKGYILRPQNYTPLKPKRTATFETEDPGKMLDVGESLKLCTFDLRDWYDLNEPGYYAAHFEFDEVELKMPRNESIWHISGPFKFILGTPPTPLSPEEQNQGVPPLGDKDAVERIRKLIKETCKPPPAKPTVPDTAPWSQAVGGLQARIVYVSRGWHSGYEILIALKNVSANPMVVPMGHPAQWPQAGLFEFLARTGSAEWQSVETFKSQMKMHDDSSKKDGNVDTAPPAVAPTATLAPGQMAIVYLASSYETAIPKEKEISEVKIVLHQPAQTAPKDGWQGVLETPPTSLFRSGNAKGPWSFPAFFPALNPYGFMGGNMSGFESRVRQLEISNFTLLGMLGMFESEGVRQEFERRLAAEKDQAMKDLLASVAAGEGSQAAATYLLESMKETDKDRFPNLFDALKRLVYHFDKDQPEWLLAMVEGALSDDRVVTGVVIHGSFDYPKISTECESDLTLALGQVKCRQAVPFLIEKVRKTKSCRAISSLGDIGDPRAIPVLIDALTASGKEAKYDKGFGLGPQTFSRTVGALGSLKAAEAVPLLLQYIEYPEVISALERIGDPWALGTLRDLVKSEGKITRNGQPVYPELAPQRLIYARIALASLEKGDPVPRLFALLDDKSLGEYDRWEVFRRIVDKADPRAIPVLVRLVKTDADGSIVNRSIEALGGFKSKEAVQGLIECFDADFKGKSAWKWAYTPEMFQENIAGSLRKITGANIGPDKAKWLQWWEKEGQFNKDLK